MDYNCKSPVLLIFFNRPETFIKVFEQVRKVKPKHLILAQDGKRGVDDEERIAECRRIAESIDWECEIIKDYSDTNLGCGMRPFTAIKNALDHFETIIVLEDDCVPSVSFFAYCDEMLEKYKNDERISYISGLNHFETWPCGDSDYFFAKTGSIWSWATWRRSFNKYYDYYVDGINSNYHLNLIEKEINNKTIFKSKEKNWRYANESKNRGDIKLSFWDIQWGFVKYSQNALVIVPKLNLCTNIGVGDYSTHAQNVNVKKFRKYKTFNFIPSYELPLPLKHQKMVICDYEYDNLVYSCIAGSPVTRLFSNIKKIIKGIYRKK